MENKKKGYLLITLCGVLWGFMFLFAQYLLDNGLTSQDLVSWKLFTAFLIIFIYILIKDRSLLKVDKKGFAIMMIMGFISHSMYNLFIFISMDNSSIATAVSLLYTAPIFVTILSKIFFKESFTLIKITSLIICIIGVFLTVTGGKMSALDFNKYGLGFGLLSGMCFACTSIFSKILVGSYKQVTILAYTFGFGFLFSLFFSNPLVPFQMEFNPLIWLNILLLGIVPTAMSYGLFTRGLAHGIESSKASIITTVEVPISVLGSYFIFGQNIAGWEIIGIILVVGSVILLQRDGLSSPSREMVEEVLIKN